VREALGHVPAVGFLRHTEHHFHAAIIPESRAENKSVEPDLIGRMGACHLFLLDIRHEAGKTCLAMKRLGKVLFAGILLGICAFCIVDFPASVLYAAESGGVTGGSSYLTNTAASLGVDRTVTVSFNVAGGTNLQERQPGTDPQSGSMVLAWGDNSAGQCDVPPGLGDVVAVTGGWDFSCALRRNGAILAWGAGAGRITNALSGVSNIVSISANWWALEALLANGRAVHAGGIGDPTAPANLTDLAAVSLGYGASFGLRSNGTLVAWGYPTWRTNVPTGLSNVVSVAVGANHTVAVLNDGTVRAWGARCEPLGWNLTEVPVEITNAVSAAAGMLHSAVLCRDGSVVAWGCNSDGQTSVPTGLNNVVALSAGLGHTLALKADSTVVQFGGLPPNDPMPSQLTNVVAIGSGPRHCLALRTGPLTPVILQNPQNQIVAHGQPVTFTVRAFSLTANHYQWLFNGANCLGSQDSSTLTIASAQPADQGSYSVIVSNAAGSTVSASATLTVAEAPTILYPLDPVVFWSAAGSPGSLIPQVSSNSAYPLSYQWSRNGAILPDAVTPVYQLATQNGAKINGEYTVTISNCVGVAASASWIVRTIAQGSIAAWGDDEDDECEVPADLTNAVALAAGEYHALALKEDGYVTQWGYEWGAVPLGLSNIVAVAAGYCHSLALRDDGTLEHWGAPDSVANWVPAGMTGVKAIAAGWYHNLALLADGHLVAWGTNDPGATGINLTDVPASATNVTAIAACKLHSLALRAHGTVVAWGDPGAGKCDVPPGLSNVVAIAAGGDHCLALRRDGTVTAWGSNACGQTNVPPGLSNVMAIAAGENHSVALRNDGTLVTWGTPGYGLTKVVGPNPVKLLAAGGNFTLAGVFSPLTQYPVEANRDLLLICNTNSADSIFIKDYYLAHRPMAGNANVLGIGCPPQFTVSPQDFTNLIAAPLARWLDAHPTKWPQYLILFKDVPSNINEVTNDGPHAPPLLNSVSCQIYSNWVGIRPFVTHINMQDEWSDTPATNACVAYINKLEQAGTNGSTRNLFISRHDQGYSDTNFVIDNVFYDDTGLDGLWLWPATNGLLAAGVSPTQIMYAEGIEPCTHTNDSGSCDAWSVLPHITSAENVAAYISWGSHSDLSDTYAWTIDWRGDSGWWIIETMEAFDGIPHSGQGEFYQWFSGAAFGGANYSNTPVGAVTCTDVPFISGHNNASVYFGLWAAGKNFGICAWNSRQTPRFQAVGDPFVRR
jgi:alpha-tubulin suppressor-like RCC1 family protein